jgi:hypothetical protein
MEAISWGNWLDCRFIMKLLLELLFSDVALPSIGVKAYAVKVSLACKST